MTKKRDLRPFARIGGGNWLDRLQFSQAMSCVAGLLLLVLFAVAPRTLLPTFKTGLDEWYRRSVHKPLRQRHWNKVAAMQQALPRFSCMEISSDLSEFHTQVITLERLPERREGLVNALESAGVEYEVFFGTDGIEDISEPLRDHYAGPLTKALITGQGFRENSRRQYWLDLIKAKVNGTIGETDKEKLRRRMDFAAKLSQVQLLHKMVSAGWRYMMVLEDDAALVDGFTEKLQAALCSMPNNWAVFYLNACHERSGAIVGDNVRQFIDGSCLLGYVVTLEFALSVLYERAPRSDRRFDHIVMRGGHTEAAYIADPPLLEFTNAKAIVNELSHTDDRPEWDTRGGRVV